MSIEEDLHEGFHESMGPDDVCGYCHSSEEDRRIANDRFLAEVERRAGATAKEMRDFASNMGPEEWSQHAEECDLAEEIDGSIPDKCFSHCSCSMKFVWWLRRILGEEKT